MCEATDVGGGVPRSLRLLVGISARALFAAALALTLFSADPSAAARPGDLDPTFGENGFAETAPDFVAYRGAVFASAVLRQPDGKLIAVGSIGFDELALVRFNVDGTLDPTFGASGWVVSTVASDAFAAVLQSDGKILIATQGVDQAMEGSNGPLQLVRFLPEGAIDAEYGSGGTVVYPPSNGGQFGQFLDARSIVLEPDGRAVVSADSSYVSVCCTPASNCFPGGGSFIALLRFGQDGSIDRSYGDGGVACTSLLFGGFAAAQPDGAIVVTGQRRLGNNSISDVLVSRFDASGRIDPTFGSNGTAPVTVSPPPQLVGAFYSLAVDTIVVQPDGKLLLGLSGPNGQAIPVATRLNADGSIDPQFAGGQGAFAVIGDAKAATAHLPSPAGGPTFAALQSDGKVVLASRPWDNPSAALHFGVARFNADGTLDSNYGSSGVVIGPPGGPASILVQADDKLVILDGQSLDFRLARFLAASSTDVGLATSANPSPPGQNLTLTAAVAAASASATVQFRDGSFVIPGCAAVPLSGTSGNLAASCSSSSLALGSHVMTAAYSGDATNAPGQSPLLVQVVDEPGTDMVVEYQYPAWNHFFMTSLASEIAALDGGAFPGWQRTGQTFAVYPTNTPLSTTQCRFFSGSAFAPKSSHFYSPDQGECGAVYFDESDVWILEGNISPVLLPDSSGACPPGARPLYRLYNNGMGGAPNHRYTTSLDIQASMIAQGWVPEGAGSIGVIACVPGN